jgi:hypothetical protein
MHEGIATTTLSFGQIRGPTRCTCQETSTTPTLMAGTPASQKRVQLATAPQRLTPEARSIRILRAKAVWLVISAVAQTRPARSRLAAVQPVGRANVAPGARGQHYRSCSSRSRWHDRTAFWSHKGNVSFDFPLGSGERSKRRHSHCSAMLEATRSPTRATTPAAIQGWLGHRSIASTAVYTALAPNWSHRYDARFRSIRA